MAEPVAASGVARLPTSLFTARNVADLLGLSLAATKRIPPDELPYARVGARGDRRYQAEDVAGYLRAKRVGGATPA